jgi:RNA polymerase Rpb2, domain 3
MGRDSTLRRLAALTALVLALGASACGGDDDDDGDGGEEAAAPTEVTVTADEYSFEPSADPGPETETIVMENVGEESHALIFARLGEGFTVEEAFEMEGRGGSAEVLGETGAPAGDSGTLKVRDALEPGNYAMICPVETPDGESHFELGQVYEFTIE